MPIKINGLTSGYTEVKAADTAANNTVTLPSSSGTLATSTTTNTFTANQVIEVTDNTNAALRITQLGTGEAIRVEDSTNPDSTPFVVTSAGDVGIGASPSDYPLDVYRNRNAESAIRLSNTDSGASAAAMYTLAGTSGRYINIKLRAQDQYFQINGSGITSAYYDIDNHYFRSASGSLRAKIDASGPYTLYGTGLNAGIQCYNTIGAKDYRVIQKDDGFFHITNETAAATLLNFAPSNNQLNIPSVYNITGTGSAVVVASGGNIYRTSSSIKYKKDVEDLDPALTDNAIANLRPVWYRSKEASGDDKAEWSHIGLIAEEVDQVEKRLVRYRTVEVTTDENGQRVETVLETPEPEDVDYARLSVLLLDKVQRMSAKITALEARIAALENV